MFSKLPFNGAMLKKLIGIGAGAVLGPIGFLVPEALNLINAGIAKAQGREAPALVQDHMYTAKGLRTYIAAAVWATGTVAAAIGLWDLPPNWNEIASYLILGTLTAKKLK